MLGLVGVEVEVGVVCRHPLRDVIQTLRFVPPPGFRGENTE